MRSSDFGPEMSPNNRGTLSVEVRPAADHYELPIERLMRWLESQAKSPKEMLKKERLRALLK
jgi:hypothetical protein